MKNIIKSVFPFLLVTLCLFIPTKTLGQIPLSFDIPDQSLPINDPVSIPFVIENADEAELENLQLEILSPLSCARFEFHGTGRNRELFIIPEEGATCDAAVTAQITGTSVQDVFQLTIEEPIFPPVSPITISIDTNSGRPLIEWPRADWGNFTYYVYRKEAGAANFDTLLTNSVASFSTSYVDITAEPGSNYEYKVEKKYLAPYDPAAFSQISGDLVLDRGTLILIIDETFFGACDTPDGVCPDGLHYEIKRLEQDLIGDGWAIIKHIVSRSASVQEIKDLIQADYQNDPANVNSIFLLGHIPIPYSGWTNQVDRHHKRAFPADVFYAELDGPWTDEGNDFDWKDDPITVGEECLNSVNLPFPNQFQCLRPETRNFPGDGIFDESKIPSDVDLKIGRVDFFDLPVFRPKTEKDLLRQYLNKDHSYRHKKWSVERRGLNYNGGEMWTSLTTLFGAAHTYNQRLFPELKNNSYLWAGQFGTGNYWGLNNGQPDTFDFAESDPKAVFYQFAGSYFSEWDYIDGFMRAILATPTYSLASIYNYPFWITEPLGLGETLGHITRLSQNNANGNYGSRYTHVALMGDPTLRLHPVAPPENLIANNTVNGVLLDWDEPADAIEEYLVYRATSAQGPFELISHDGGFQTLTSYLDDDTLSANQYTYMVRSVKRELSPAGIYLNPSQGAFCQLAVGNPTLTASITYPADGATVLGGLTFSSPVSVPINVTTADNAGSVNKVEYFIDGEYLLTDTAAPFTAQWVPAGLSEGAHDIMVRAYSSSGAIAQNAVTVQLQKTDPIVVITEPLNADHVWGNVLVRANADTKDGIARVEFEMDGQIIKTKTQPPYDFLLTTYNWQVIQGEQTVSDGPHQLTIRAIDHWENSFDDTISVTVDSSLSQPTILMSEPSEYFTQPDEIVSINYGFQGGPRMRDGAVSTILVNTATGAEINLDRHMPSRPLHYWDAEEYRYTVNIRIPPSTPLGTYKIMTAIYGEDGWVDLIPGPDVLKDARGQYRIGTLFVTDDGQLHRAIDLDQNIYGPSQSPTISINDYDANTDHGAIDQITCTLSSDTETTPETLTLTETGNDTGFFTGSIALSSGPVQPDGQVQVSDEDRITASYHIPASGETIQAEALIDAQAPAMPNANTIFFYTTEPPLVNALLGVRTDELSNIRILYGTGDLGSATTGDPNPVNIHYIELPGLDNNTDYHYALELTDQYGNTFLDDNGGQNYLLHVPAYGPSTLTAEFNGSPIYENPDIQIEATVHKDRHLCSPFEPFEPCNSTTFQVAPDINGQISFDLLEGAQVSFAIVFHNMPGNTYQTELMTAPFNEVLSLNSSVSTLTLVSDGLPVADAQLQGNIQRDCLEDDFDCFPQPFPLNVDLNGQASFESLDGTQMFFRVHLTEQAFNYSTEILTTPFNETIDFTRAPSSLTIQTNGVPLANTQVTVESLSQCPPDSEFCFGSMTDLITDGNGQVAVNLMPGEPVRFYIPMTEAGINQYISERYHAPFNETLNLKIVESTLTLINNGSPIVGAAVTSQIPDYCRPGQQCLDRTANYLTDINGQIRISSLEGEEANFHVTMSSPFSYVFDTQSYPTPFTETIELNRSVSIITLMENGSPTHAADIILEREGDCTPGIPSVCSYTYASTEFTDQTGQASFLLENGTHYRYRVWDRATNLRFVTEPLISPQDTVIDTSGQTTKLTISCDSQPVNLEIPIRVLDQFGMPVLNQPLHHSNTQGQAVFWLPQDQSFILELDLPGDSFDLRTPLFSSPAGEIFLDIPANVLSSLISTVAIEQNGVPVSNFGVNVLDLTNNLVTGIYSDEFGRAQTFLEPGTSYRLSLQEIETSIGNVTTDPLTTPFDYHYELPANIDLTIVTVLKNGYPVPGNHIKILPSRSFYYPDGLYVNEAGQAGFILPPSQFHDFDIMIGHGSDWSTQHTGTTYTPTDLVYEIQDADLVLSTVRVQDRGTLLTEGVRVKALNPDGTPYDYHIVDINPAGEAVFALPLGQSFKFEVQIPSVNKSFTTDAFTSPGVLTFDLPVPDVVIELTSETLPQGNVAIALYDEISKTIIATSQTNEVSGAASFYLNGAVYEHLRVRVADTTWTAPEYQSPGQYSLDLNSIPNNVNLIVSNNGTPEPNASIVGICPESPEVTIRTSSGEDGTVSLSTPGGNCTISSLGSNRQSKNVIIPEIGQGAITIIFDPAYATAQMTSPLSGEELTSHTTTFEWDEGQGVSEYHLSIGSTVGGTEYLDQSMGTQLSVDVSIPLSGQPLFARLGSLINGVWHFNDYSYERILDQEPLIDTSLYPSSGLYRSGRTLWFIVRASDPDSDITSLAVQGLPSGIDRRGMRLVGDTLVVYYIGYLPTVRSDTQYQITVQVYEGETLFEKHLPPITVLSDDPPPTPQQVQAEGISVDQIRVSWNEVVKSGRNIRYIIYRSGTAIANVSELEYIDQDLSANTSYSYTVKAIDEFGFLSPPSTTVTASTLDYPFHLNDQVYISSSFDADMYEYPLPGSPVIADIPPGSQGQIVIPLDDEDEYSYHEDINGTRFWYVWIESTSYSGGGWISENNLTIIQTWPPGSIVQIISAQDADVLSYPGSFSPVISTEPSGSLGQLRDGPSREDGIDYYQVWFFDSGIAGWVGQRLLQLRTNDPNPTPSPSPSPSP